MRRKASGNDQLNIAALARCTRALGPGLRAVVWVQGCPLHCRGCVAPDWIPFVESHLMTPQQILDSLDLDQISGLTFSGGEPMAQAAGLAALVRLARGRKDLDLICFTGYRYERLVHQPPNAGVPALLAEIDVLIDGPYVQALNDGVGLRGSSNQRIIHLTPRLEGFAFDSAARSVEIVVSDGDLSLVGIPTPGILAAVQQYEAEVERMADNERS